MSTPDATAAEASRLAAAITGPPLTWVVTGDSITQASEFTGGRRGYGEHLAERVRAGAELGRTGDAVLVTGVEGSTTHDALDEFHWRIGRFAPDVVTLMFGANDRNAGPDGLPSFRFDLDQLLQRSRDTGALVVLQTPPPARSGGADPGQAAAYAQAVREVAGTYAVLLADHDAHWRRAGDGEHGPAQWYADAVHPGARGQLELARVLLSALGLAADDSPVCRLTAE